jgi:hypothetical protein
MTDAPKATEPEKPHNKLDENKPEVAKDVKAPAKGSVRLRTRIGEVFDLSGHDVGGVVTHAGRTFTSDESDLVRTLARKAGVVLETEK